MPASDYVHHSLVIPGLRPNQYETIEITGAKMGVYRGETFHEQGRCDKERKDLANTFVAQNGLTFIVDDSGKIHATYDKVGDALKAAGFTEKPHDGTLATLDVGLSNPGMFPEGGTDRYGTLKRSYERTHEGQKYMDHGAVAVERAAANAGIQAASLSGLMDIGGPGPDTLRKIDDEYRREFGDGSSGGRGR